MTDIPLPLRSARMSVLGRALKQADLEFPLTLEFPGDGEHGRTEATFQDRASLERTLTDAQVNAVKDDLAIYTLPDGGLVLAERKSADPWRDHVGARKPSWLGERHRWFGGR